MTSIRSWRPWGCAMAGCLVATLMLVLGLWGFGSWLSGWGRLDSPSTTTSDLLEWPPFAVLRRGPRDPRYRILGDFDGRLARALEPACAVWSEVGCGPRAASATESVDVTISWQRGLHGNCPMFLAGVQRYAHTVFRGETAEIHLNQDLGFETDSLIATLAHELGHVLGLDHAAHRDALMAATLQPWMRRLRPADRWGIIALWDDRSAAGLADLEVSVRGEDGRLERRCLLRGFAPPGVSWQVFDADGDGRDELLLWPDHGWLTGSLLRVAFDDAGRMVRTFPLLSGAVPTGYEHRLGRTANGERYWTTLSPTGRHVALLFDALGRPLRPWPTEQPLEALWGEIDPPSANVPEEFRSRRVAPARFGPTSGWISQLEVR